jgi:GT2 family glycosyltransferase
MSFDDADASDGHLVSVVIVNYNGKPFLEACLQAVSTVAFSKYRHEVVIVDNQSSDGSQAWLRQCQGITYIESPTNTGFTGGNNLGVKAAKGDVILLLNNDTRVESCLDSMVDELLSNQVGVVGCQLRYGDGRIQFSTGYEHTPLRIVLSWLGLEKRSGLPRIFRRLETNPTFYDSPHSAIDWVSGAALLTHTKLWRKLGGLDDNFFMYCEDVDYCRRVRLAGQRISYVSGARITHYEGAGKEWIGVNALLRTSRSYVLYVRKHFGAVRARLMATGLSTLFLTRALAFQLKSVFKRQADARRIQASKADAYAKAGTQLMLCALTGQTPRQP